MKSIVGILLIGMFFLSSSFMVNNTNLPLTFKDLSKKEKKEAVAYMLSTGNCEWKGIKLHGKVKFVTSFPDIKIQYVNSFPDIKVKFVNSFPDDCGEWKEVSNFPDFTVQVVNSFPDLKVKKVTSFPGMN